MTPTDKAALLAALRRRLAERLDALTLAQKSAQSGATHPDNKQEHAKDMRSTEASYLARGLAERVETLRDGIRAVELVPAAPLGVAAPGAVVLVEDDDGESRLYLLAPAGAGELLAGGKDTVLVVTPQSPIGAAIAGRSPGDRIDIELPGGRRGAEIVRVF